MRCVTQLDVTGNAQDRSADTTTAKLKLVDVAFHQAPSPGPLEGGVCRELDDVRPPRCRRTDSAPPEHAGGVDDVRCARPRANQRCRPDVDDALGQLAGDEVNRIIACWGRLLGRRDNLDAMAASEQKRDDVRSVTRGPSDIRRPDSGNDENVQGATTSTGAGPGTLWTSGSRRMRRNRKIQ